MKKMDNFDLKKYLAEGKLHENEFGGKAHQRFFMVMEKIIDIIKYHELDPSDVLEEIGQEFGINFEFGRG